MPQSPYKHTNFFMTWDDVVWIPRRNTIGQTVGLDVRISLRNFKGYGLNKSLRISKTSHLYIRTVRSPKNTISDLGSALVAHAIKSGVFGPGVTVEQIWERPELKSRRPSGISRPTRASRCGVSSLWPRPDDSDEVASHNPIQDLTRWSTQWRQDVEGRSLYKSPMPGCDAA